MMDTLARLRPHETIVEYTDEISDKQSVAYLLVEIKKNPIYNETSYEDLGLGYSYKESTEISGNIVVVVNHSDDIKRTILEEIDATDSGRLFLMSELDVDPVNNCMVPRHRPATRSEIEWLIQNHVPWHKLPVIKMKDPIRRWHNFYYGSVVAVERASDKYFRRVN